MKSVSQIPGSLAIVKLDERRYQLTDTSVPSIGLCLGVFPSHAAAESFADKFAKIRARAPAGQSKDRSTPLGAPETLPTPMTPQRAPQIAQSIH
jgi:hypothetical protein